MAMEKHGVACNCVDDVPPTDLTKVASGDTYKCSDCGRDWPGMGPDGQEEPVAV